MESTLVDVGGYRLASHLSGTGAPPVVFVSEYGGAGSTWDGVRADLWVPLAEHRERGSLPDISAVVVTSAVGRWRRAAMDLAPFTWQQVDRVIEAG